MMIALWFKIQPWAWRLLLVLVACALWAPPSALAQGANQAVLVTVFGADDVVTECIGFPEPEINGADLLNRSALNVITSSVAGQGTAVCKIREVGCDFPGEDCFCQCPGAPCAYWTLWQWQDGAWITSSRGADRAMLTDGGMQAWVWGDGNTAPPNVNPASVCAQADPTATPVPPNQQSSDEPYPGGSDPPAGGGGDDYPPPGGSSEPEEPEPTEPPPAEEPTEIPPTEEPTDAPTRTPAPREGATADTPAAGTPETDTPEPGAPTATAHAEATATRTPAPRQTPSPTGAAEEPTDTPEATITPDAAATLIARAATEAQPTLSPTAEAGEARRRGYWVFVGLAGLLTAAVVYAILLRRQQMQ